MFCDPVLRGRGPSEHLVTSYKVAGFWKWRRVPALAHISLKRNAFLSSTSPPRWARSRRSS
jgi:hypothetical protein